MGHGRKGDFGYIIAHLSDPISALLIGIANAILIGMSSAQSEENYRLWWI
jgi:hypothetical protein